jgi:hypothetical protein
MAKPVTKSESPQVKTLAEAQQLVDEQFATIQKQNTLIQEQNQMITELESKGKQSGGSKPTIKIGKVVYQVNSGAKINGRTYSATELAEDTDAAQKVIEKEGQNILTVIGD